MTCSIYYIGMSVLCEHAIAAYFTYCHILRTFQQSTRVAYFFRIFDSNFNILCVSVSISIRCVQKMVAVGPLLAQTSTANTNCTCAFQGWANHVTTADPINTHGYHNHVCSGGELWLHVRCQIYANMQLWPISPYLCRIFGVYMVSIFF